MHKLILIAAVLAFTPALAGDKGQKRGHDNDAATEAVGQPESQLLYEYHTKSDKGRIIEGDIDANKYKNSPWRATPCAVSFSCE